MARQALQNNSRQPKVQIIFAFLIRESSVSTYENVYSQGSWLSAYLFSVLALPGVQESPHRPCVCLPSTVLVQRGNNRKEQREAG